ncbi:MAG: AAA family ATPase [Syntrophaceae bacterium]|nr:AAA family ATPase [Syntrophaceae bacterium]
MKYIWPIGGSKGGSGKSFLTGSLGILLAMHGKKTLLIDADFGAANLHTLMGISNPERNLSDFINHNVKTLGEAVIKTSVPNLFMISGARNNLDMANIVHMQKLKVLRAIARLPYEYILLDLGAGTSFNTIDFFMMSDSGIFVTTPEPTSIENVYRLTRSVYVRKIRHMLSVQEFRTMIEMAMSRSKDGTIDYLEDLIDIVKEHDPEKGKLIEKNLSELKFKLVINQVRQQDNPNLGILMCKIIEKHIGITMQFLGNIGFDDRVHDAVCRKTAFVYKYPYTQTTTDLREICNNILLTGN